MEREALHRHLPEYARDPRAYFDSFMQRGLTPFPATAYPPEAHTITSYFPNEYYPRSHGERERPPLLNFRILAPLHTSYPAEWPIDPSIPRALKGFRAAIRFSQVKFADKLHISRVSIERWEADTVKPFRGDTITLLNALIPIVEALAECGELDGPALQDAAGQLLNFAAAIVCPRMTRPTATYIGRDIVAPLQGASQALSYGVLSALTSSEVLLNADQSNDEMDARFVPLAGLHMTDHATEPWEHEAHALLRRLTPDDRQVLLDLARRLARRVDPGASP